jgi:hypothetical protein
MKKAYILGLVLGAAALTARADIIPTLSSTTPNGSNFTWNYSSNVTIDQQVNPGDFFTIYDFGNFVSGSNSQPLGWTFSSALTGLNPSLVTPVDKPTLLNLTWTYNGQGSLVGPQGLGTFAIVTNTNQLSTGDFASKATRSTGPNAGTEIDNVGTVSVPVPEMSALLPILSVCGAGLLSMLPTLLRRKSVA